MLSFGPHHRGRRKSARHSRHHRRGALPRAKLPQRRNSRTAQHRPDQPAVIARWQRCVSALRGSENPGRRAAKPPRALLADGLPLPPQYPLLLPHRRTTEGEAVAFFGGAVFSGISTHAVGAVEHHRLLAGRDAIALVTIVDVGASWRCGKSEGRERRGSVLCWGSATRTARNVSAGCPIRDSSSSSETAADSRHPPTALRQQAGLVARYLSHRTTTVSWDSGT